MKHKQKYSLKYLTLDQFNAKFKTLESICTSSGALNSMITKNQHDNFMKSEIYQQIIHDTQCLNMFENVSVKTRVAYLNKKIKIERCNMCNRPYLYAKNEQKTYKLCQHKQKYSESSKSKLNQSKRAKMQQFMSSLADHELKLENDEFKQLLMHYSSMKDNYAYICTQNPDFFHDLVVKTENVIQVDSQELHIGWRVYCATHGIFTENDIPRCKYCGKPTYILNRITGFAKSCLECSLKASNDTRALHNKQIVDSIVNKDKYEIIEYPKLFSYDYVKTKCKKCGHVSQHRFICGVHTRFTNAPLCFNCERKRSSAQQYEVFAFVQSIVDCQVIQGNRKCIAPKELDIFIPSLNKAIEFNGLYWHSFIKGDKNKYRHRDKVMSCQKANVELFTLFSDLWMTKPNVVKNYLCKFINFEHNQSKNINDICIKTIDYVDAEEFHQKENIFGSVKSNINYGAFYNERLIAVVSIRESIYNKHVQYELTRFSCQCGYSETSLLNEIMHTFESDHKDHLKSIIWYCKLESPIERKLAYAIGFTHIRNLKPDYMYVANGYLQRLNKHYFSKQHQKECLKVFDPCKSEIDNMETNGYKRVFDCGKEVWIKTY